MLKAGMSKKPSRCAHWLNYFKTLLQLLRTHICCYCVIVIFLLLHFSFIFVFSVRSKVWTYSWKIPPMKTPKRRGLQYCQSTRHRHLEKEYVYYCFPSLISSLPCLLSVPSHAPLGPLPWLLSLSLFASFPHVSLPSFPTSSQVHLEDEVLLLGVRWQRYACPSSMLVNGEIEVSYQVR